MTRTAYYVVGTLPVATLVVSSCAKVAGLDEYTAAGPTGAEAGACGSFTWDKNSACGACIADSCCDENAECRGDPTCSALASCLALCAGDDGRCQGSCYGASKTSATGKWLGCLTTQCTASCVSCASFGASFGPDCATCTLANACDHAQDCASDTECTALLACELKECQGWDLDPACRVACMDEHPQGVAIYKSWATGVSNCSDQCRWGGHWACATPSLPAMPFGEQGQDAQVTVRVTQAVGAQGVPDITVRSCDDTLGCDGSGVTGPDGTTILMVPQSRPTIGLTYSGRYFELSSASGQRELAYPGRAFTSASAALSLFWVTGLQADAGPGQALVPDKGLLMVAMADCLGSSLYGTARTTTAELVDGPPVIYADIGSLPDPNLSSGPFAFFEPVEPGFREVRIFDPDGAEVTRSRCCESGSMAIPSRVLYVNVPVYL